MNWVGNITLNTVIKWTLGITDITWHAAVEQTYTIVLINMESILVFKSMT